MKSSICLGSAQFGMEYGITNKTGKIKQKDVAKIDLLPDNLIFGIGLLPFEFWWYFAPFLDIFSRTNKRSIKNSKTKDN